MDELDIKIQDYEEFANQLEGVVNQLKVEKTLEDRLDLLDMFYTEGWEFNYAVDGSFYMLGERNRAIENLLTKYGDEALEHQEKYAKIKNKVWKLLPDFYLQHTPPFKYIETPENYKLNKPFNI
ncbi:hypothetical protein C4564_05945 [Candidatus Microgenomates bacterium]|nr:MAG: hypothetical protein C4564_05945 [Candidatus Microgenomates bacterium]